MKPCLSIVTTLLAMAPLMLWSTPTTGAVPPTQVISVEARGPLSQTAILRTWRLTSSGHYIQVFGSFVAEVGVNGARALVLAEPTTSRPYFKTEVSSAVSA
jgi:uncharacterized membrane protein